MSVVDGDLLPYTQYSYSVTATNSIASVDSDWTTATTYEAKPSHIAAPHCQTYNEQLDTIDLFWSPPAAPNGMSKSENTSHIVRY